MSVLKTNLETSLGLLSCQDESAIFVDADSDLGLSLLEVLARFQSDRHEEILSAFGETIMLSVEDLPEYLVRNDHSRGLVIQQLCNSKPSEKKPVSVDREIQEVHQSTSTPIRSSSSATDGQPDLDTTGSPLKCPFAINEEDPEFNPLTFSCHSVRKSSKKVTSSYRGLPLYIARKLAFRIISTLKESSFHDSSISAVWIACNALDIQRTSFLGVQWNENRITLSNVTSSGPFIGTDNLPTVDHLNFHFCFACPMHMIESRVKAIYEVLSDEDGDDGSTIHLFASWKRPLATLSPPSLDAVTTAQVHIKMGDPRSHLHQIYLELAALDSFICGLETGEINWYIDTEDPSVELLLEEYFTCIATKGEKHKTTENMISTFDEIIESQLFKARLDMDFTDSLWNILWKSKSYKELQNGLHQIFTAISSGSVRPKIYVNNNTQVAEISRKLMRGNIQDVDLKGLTPVEMLIEIGLEKIKRDYINIFHVCELVTREQLQPFINWNPVKEPYKDCMKLLKQMHKALQLFVALWRYLKLPQPVLAQCTSNALKDIKQEEEKEDFSFPLQTSLLTNNFASLLPLLWRLNMKCETEEYYKSLDFYVKKDSDFFDGGNSLSCKDVIESPEGAGGEIVKFFTLAVTDSSDSFLLNLNSLQI